LHLRFEPTYKELKLSTKKNYGINEVSFEPTYKELKQEHDLKELKAAVKVLSLPIRN